MWFPSTINSLHSKLATHTYFFACIYTKKLGYMFTTPTIGESENIDSNVDIDNLDYLEPN
jgi:hypothetical protein